MVVGRAAAVLWGFGVLEASFPIELAYPGSGRPPPRRKWAPGIRYRTMYLPRAEILEGKGVAYTSAARTVVDTCRWGSFADGIVVAESYLRAGYRKSELWRVLRGIGRGHGVAKARRVLSHATEKSESVAESLAKSQIIEAGVDTRSVVQNAEMVVGRRGRRADFIIDGWLVIEVDGEIKYDGTYGDPAFVIKLERERERDFLNAGYTLYRVKWRDLRDGSFISGLRRLLERGPR
ncbi:hypothetical protein WG915_08145 [Corynebacterium sp. H128]|uniref:hypothetical protein n=1 Tax=Corynebacterium sp. H128 TaxID=3133427 RepID=UPI0030B785AB